MCNLHLFHCHIIPSVQEYIYVCCSQRSDFSLYWRLIMREEELSGLERERARDKKWTETDWSTSPLLHSAAVSSLNDLGSFTRAYSPSASSSLYHRMSRWDLKWFRSLMFERSEWWQTVTWFVCVCVDLFIRALDVSYLIRSRSAPSFSVCLGSENVSLMHRTFMIITHGTIFLHQPKLYCLQFCLSTEVLCEEKITADQNVFDV